MKVKSIIVAVLLMAIPGLFWMYMFMNDYFFTPDELRQITMLGGTLTMILYVLATVILTFNLTSKDITSADRMVYKP